MGKYYQSSVSNLEGDMRQSGSHYLDKDTKKFFGSQIKRDDVFVSEDKKTYLFKENLNNASEGSGKYKVVKFDKQTGKTEDLYFGTDNSERNKVLKKELSGN